MTLFDTLSIGELIQKLESFPDPKKDRKVYYDWLWTGVDPYPFSYRGYYDHLSISVSKDENTCSLSVLIDELKKAVGKSFYGYKGGNYTMEEGTPVWASRWGNLGVCIIDARVLWDDGPVLLITKTEGSS